jgi:hypothetical protein
MKYFSSRICNFYIKKLSTADAITAAEKIVGKAAKLCKLTFYTFNIRKTKKILLESKFLIPKF